MRHLRSRPAETVGNAVTCHPELFKLHTAHTCLPRTSLVNQCQYLWQHSLARSVQVPIACRLAGR